MNVVKIIYMTCMVLSLQGVINILQTIGNQQQQQQGGNNAALDHSALPPIDTQPRLLTTTGQQQQQESPTRPPVRVLFGVFSHDSMEAAAYRWQFRRLFESFKNNGDYRVCSLWELEQAVMGHTYTDNLQQPGISQKDKEKWERKLAKEVEVEQHAQIYQHCTFVYTFVIGGNLDKDAPTILVDKSLPLLASSKTDKRRVTRDVKLSNRKHKFGDMTMLNIKENMNEGKSQTWFYYGSVVAEQLGVQDGIDYVAKLDADALPYLDRFFDWALVQKRLPPYPYNNHILVGNPVDKYWWYTFDQVQGNYTYIMKEKDIAREEYFKHHYFNNFHLYAQGQCYILSVDLARFVAKEAAAISYIRHRPKEIDPHTYQSSSRYNYTESHEDHDISAMAFHSPFPIQFQFFNRYQKFWRHPIKNQKNVKLVHRWDTEIERINKWIPLHQNEAMEGYWMEANGWLLPLNQTWVDDPGEDGDSEEEKRLNTMGQKDQEEKR